MQRTVEISAAHYEEMRKQPLFFVKLYEYIFYDVNGKSIINLSGSLLTATWK